MFVDFWNVCFLWLSYFLEWGKKVVDLVSDPIKEVVYGALNVSEGSVIDVLLDLALSLVGEFSLIELMFGVGFPLYFVFLLIKFFVGLAD